jgi:hypothetical protein
VCIHLNFVSVKLHVQCSLQVLSQLPLSHMFHLKDQPSLEGEVLRIERRPLAILGADAQAIPGADAQAIPEADARAILGADARAILGADARAILGADARAILRADAQAIPGAETQANLGTESQANLGTEAQASGEADFPRLKSRNHLHHGSLTLRKK